MSDAGERDGWNKAQRLVVAGAIAPSLRKASTRRVKVVDRVTGEVKREAILGEVLEGLAKAHGLEIDVECPEEFCSMYPKCRARTPKSQLQPRRVAMRKGAWKCRGCIRYDARRWEEATCASGCGRKPTRWAFLSYSKGKAWRCHPCAVGRVGDRLDPAAVECVSGCGRHPTRDGLRAARRKKAPWRCGKCAWRLRRAHSSRAPKPSPKLDIATAKIRECLARHDSVANATVLAHLTAEKVWNVRKSLAKMRRAGEVVMMGRKPTLRLVTK